MLFDGGDVGFSSLVIMSPDENIGVALLTNTDSAGESLFMMAQEVFKVIIETKTGKHIVETATPHQITLTDREQEQFEGWYVSEQLGLFEVYKHTSSLRARADGKTFSLTPYENGRFKIKYLLLGFLPISIPIKIGLHEVDGDIVAPLYSGWMTLGSGRKVERPTASEIWNTREGTYEPINTDDDRLLIVPWMKVRYENGFVLLDTEVFGEEFTLPLLPQTDEYYLSGGLGRRAGETVLFREQDGTTYLTYSGYIYRKTQTKR